MSNETSIFFKRLLSLLYVKQKLVIAQVARFIYKGMQNFQYVVKY